MDIELWEGGLLAHEVTAIEKIKKCFQDINKTKSKNNQNTSRGSLKDQLGSLKQQNTDSIFPWKGYAGFRLVDNGKEGEFDLVIITHCNVIIVELKDWKGRKITYQRGNWFLGNEDRGKSPVEITRNKKYLLERKLRKYKGKFTNKAHLPQIHFLVVITGDADVTELTEDQRQHTLTLNEFLSFKDRNKFNKIYRPHPDSQVLNKDFHIFDKVFDRNTTKPKQISLNGYSSQELIFKHPKDIYQEFEAAADGRTKDTALMRIWDFDKVAGDKAKTPDGRYDIISREREVLTYIKNSNYDLYQHCLNSLATVQKDQISAQHTELYELKPNHIRVNTFINRYLPTFSEADRIKLIKLLLSRFANLHKSQVAHRDIGDHSVWFAPSKDVALSSFVSAYHKPQGTVGDLRELLSVEGSIPFGMNTDKNTTPYQLDVYTLGVMVWHLLNGKQIDEKSLKTFKAQLENDTHWTSTVINEAICGGFNNAGEMYDALLDIEPKAKINLDFDASLLEPYLHGIKLNRQYQEDDAPFIVETDEKEVYLSDGLLVKAWLNVSVSKADAQICTRLLHFLQKVSKLKSISPTYLPNIYNFGIANKSNELFIVSEFINGNTWNGLKVGENNLVLVEKLIHVIEHLHSLQIAHGDLHPENIIIDANTQDIKLIDLPDFSLSSEECKNHLYSPDNIDGASAFERDNFAVMKLSLEALGGDWDEVQEEFAELHQAIQVELNDNEYGFKSLERFKDALNPTVEEVEMAEISVRGEFESLEILPENGVLYADIFENDRNENELKIELSGVGGSITLIYIPTENRFKLGLAPRQRSDVSKRFKDKAKLELNFGLKISSTEYSQLNALNERILQLPEFKRAVEVATYKENSTNVSLESESQVTSHHHPELESQPSITPIGIRTTDLWKNILKTEAESYPYVILDTDSESVQDESDQVILNYESETDPLAKFKKTDVIEAIKLDDDNEKLLGLVDLKKSSFKEVRLFKARSAAKHLQETEEVFFRTKADKSSYEKRKDALQRILDNESTIMDLVDYFEPTSNKPPIEYDIEVTDKDFERYRREDDKGNVIELNDQQKTAFRQLLATGPVSLLQGPPGTGKTEFIAAFVHYLVEKQGAEKILLVSQSHEAVNTAASRIRKHCLRLKTDLDVVRFSNKEASVSDGLKDVYSQYLIDERRAMFTAESKQRISSLHQSLGVPKDFLEDACELELSIVKQIDCFNKLTEEAHADTTEKTDKEELSKQASQLIAQVKITISELFDIEVKDDDLNELSSKLWARLEKSYSIKPQELQRAKALCKISRDLIDVLENERVNYDEFFARSRQLITGTCVGIGQRHIGISENQYDWVIIDEAARSIASELAIAMQAGKRILLVGDHHQLPPLYTTPHKKALAKKLGVYSDDIDLDELLQSDFERAFESKYGKAAGAKLLTQYRMVEPIGDLVSECFYKGELKTGIRPIPDSYQNLPEVMKSYTTWIDTAWLGKRAYHQDDSGSSIANTAEVKVIIKLLNQIHSNAEQIEDLVTLKTNDKGELPIGIICMYAEQKKRLRRKVAEQSWSDTFKSLIRIDTVDSYQGKENRIVILSISRSDSKLSPGFLRSPNRINVGLSRAMDRLVIVGNSNMWRGKNQNLPLGKVIDYIEQHAKTEPKGFKVINANTFKEVKK
ncbi:nuclease [Parashewanella spongiae]|uniref:Nuclease n=1 Tax=Parashewanella spongiae TaxID=342950 RepID=A0A3A6U8V3_9GAMM|nr:AAA domain-containing protein [Parashewanella spongiae]MCL1078425.1 AAA domain-containing protein [Parashewanella spongiae]RJY13306.1 nuclease [Parashewanella spongiae]